jgi:hypothetical protein
MTDQSFYHRRRWKTEKLHDPAGNGVQFTFGCSVNIQNSELGIRNWEEEA